MFHKANFFHQALKNATDNMLIEKCKKRRFFDDDAVESLEQTNDEIKKTKTENHEQTRVSIVSALVYATKASNITLCETLLETVTSNERHVVVREVIKEILNTIATTKLVDNESSDEEEDEYESDGEDSEREDSDSDGETNNEIEIEIQKQLRARNDNRKLVRESIAKNNMLRREGNDQMIKLWMGVLKKLVSHQEYLDETCNLCTEYFQTIEDNPNVQVSFLSFLPEPETRKNWRKEMKKLLKLTCLSSYFEQYPLPSTLRCELVSAFFITCQLPCSNELFIKMIEKACEISDLNMLYRVLEIRTVESNLIPTLSIQTTCDILVEFSRNGVNYEVLKVLESHYQPYSISEFKASTSKSHLGFLGTKIRFALKTTLSPNQYRTIIKTMTQTCCTNQKTVDFLFEFYDSLNIIKVNALKVAEHLSDFMIDELTKITMMYAFGTPFGHFEKQEMKGIGLHLRDVRRRRKPKKSIK